MSERDMSCDDMNCAELADVAAELALGVLTGRERAAALAHLDRCDGCRAHVGHLTMTGEQLLGLLPAAEPPPGFETRVLARLGLATPEPDAPMRDVPGRVRWSRRSGTASAPGVRRSPRVRRVLVAAAAVLALAGASLGGWGLRAAVSPPAGPPLSSAALVSATDQPAGQIFVYGGSPGWLYMYVDLPAADGTVTCQVVGADGRVTTVGSFPLTGGYGSWGAPTPVGAGAPAGARLVDADGAVLATASLPHR